MYGIPPDLDLRFLHGAELIQVSVGQHQIGFAFHPSASISVGGYWELTDPAGKILDRRLEEPDRPPYQLHRLLGRHVLDSTVSAPNSFALTFEGGEVLRIFDDSKQYESFEIQPGDIIV